MKYWVEMDVPTNVFGHSLIGVYGNPPYAWANYCWIAPKGTQFDEFEKQFKVLNMWAENIDAAIHAFNLGDTMKALVYQNAAVIIDPRIPLDWRYDRLCFTGGSGIDNDNIIEVMTEIYEYLGDKNKEVERFIDPILYYARRGEVYNPSGWITMGENSRVEAKKILEERGIV